MTFTTDTCCQNTEIGQSCYSQTLIHLESLEIEIEHLYKDIIDDIRTKFDTSNFDKINR